MRRLLIALAPLALAACGGARTPVTAAPPSPARGALPPVPAVSGPLAVRIVYPSPNQLLESRDSNFILGSVGNGSARVTIGGAPVTVAPNGAFIAFVANPPATRPVYDIVAAVGADTVRDSLRVRVAVPRLALDSLRWLDTGSVSPRGGTLALRADEPVRVSARALAGASAWVEWDTTRVVTDTVQPPTPPRRGKKPAARPAPVIRTRTEGAVVRQPLAASGESLSTDVRAGLLARGLRLGVTRGGADTARFPLARVTIVDPAAPRFASIGDDSAAAVPDTDRAIPLRPTPAGGYAWATMQGTVLEVTGRQGAFTRVRLDQQLEAWVDSEYVQLLPAGTASPRRTVGAFTVTPAAGWVDVALPIAERPAYLVEEVGNSIVLTLYGTRVAPGLIRYLGNDSLIRYIDWQQVTSDRARLTIQLAGAPYGYLALFDRGTFTLRVRRPPTIDRRHPLAGLTIAVDAGHPPGGATGPTGLTEADAVLPVADRVRELLEARGAKVVRIRTTREAYPLGQRPIDARRADAHAFVSVHLNAFGDGVNPFRENGSSVLYYHPQAEPLARDLQRALVARMGLRDLGIHFQNIAIGRETWMPSVITEGLFVIMPDQEAAMRSADGRELYARAIADGLEAYFRGLGENDRNAER